MCCWGAVGSGGGLRLRVRPEGMPTAATAAGEAGGDADEVGEALRMNGMPGRIEEGLGETLG